MSKSKTPTSDGYAFLTVAAKLLGITDIKQALDVPAEVVARSMLAEDDAEEGREAIDGALKGDRATLIFRVRSNLATPQERELALQLAAGTFKAPRGRRPVMKRQHLRIAMSIEAFRAAGMSRNAAISEAARAWCKSANTIRDIYKRNKLPEGHAAAVREYFGGCTRTEVLEAIDEFRKPAQNSLQDHSVIGV